MKKKALVIVLALVLALGIAYTAYAAEPSRDLAFFSEDATSYITQYDENKMPVFFGNGIDATLNMDTTAVFFGNQVTVKGSYANDVIVFGNTITVDAEIGGNLYMFSSAATQNGKVGGDLFNFSANFKQAATGVVDGALYAFCSSPELLGEIARSAYLFCDGAVLSGKIGGNIQGEINNLTIEDSAVVGGFVKYRSDNDPVLIGSAQSIKFERLPIIKAQPQTFAQKATSLGLSALGFAAALLLIYLLCSRLAPALSEKLRLNLRYRLAAVFGLGCAVLIGMPLIAFILMLISVRIGFALLCLYAFLILISLFVSLVALFELVTSGKKNQTLVMRMLFVALTGFVIKFLLEVPVLSTVLGLAGVIFGIGLIASLLLRPVKQKAASDLKEADVKEADVKEAEVKEADAEEAVETK